MQNHSYYDRLRLKQQARFSMGEQRIISILLPLLPSIVTFAFSLIIALQSGEWHLEGKEPNLFSMLIGSLVSLAIIPLIVGISGCFVKIFRHEITSVREAFSMATDGFFKKLGAILLMEIYLFLWSLLFIVPGIIKAFSYAMVPYVLAERPGISANAAIRLSSRIMQGHRLEFFVLQLSFIGWLLLGALTFGILTVLFTIPYMETANAGFYATVRNMAIENGTIHPEEFV